MMELTRFLVVCGVCLISCTVTRGFTRNEVLHMIESDGFVAEAHHATTSDGYILEMHRIPFGRLTQNVDVNRPVVFLMHGLLGASNSFIAAGPEHSVAYNLADAGFDVWMGNARGNTFSRFHQELDPDAENLQFFDFTWEEIGLYDLPAMIDYILEYTGQESLHYIGHSQGGTVFLVLTSMREEYNLKIRSAHLLAGVGYQNYFPNSQLSAMALMTDIIYSVSLQMGFIEVFPSYLEDVLGDEESNDVVSNKMSDYCTGDLRTKYMCELTGIRHLLRDDTIDEEEEVMLGGGSLKQIAHYGQNIRDRTFRRYSFGIIQNLGVYSSTSPPIYDLSQITTHVTHHYSLNDTLLDERDVLAMADDMPNAVARKVARDSFDHTDYVIALDAKELVTDFIIEAIRNEMGLGPLMEDETTLSTTEDVITTTTTQAPISADTPVADGSASIFSLTIYLYVIIISTFVLIM